MQHDVRMAGGTHAGTGANMPLKDRRLPPISPRETDRTVKRLMRKP